jgi:hypothetical protein
MFARAGACRRVQRASRASAGGALLGSLSDWRVTSFVAALAAARPVGPPALLGFGGLAHGIGGGSAGVIIIVLLMAARIYMRSRRGGRGGRGPWR